MTPRKIKSPSVPSKISGRRLPKRDAHRSLTAPATGWMIIAMINPIPVHKPRTPFFWSLGT